MSEKKIRVVRIEIPTINGQEYWLLEEVDLDIRDKCSEWSIIRVQNTPCRLFFQSLMLCHDEARDYF
jgi:hypothetical protein